MPAVKGRVPTWSRPGSSIGAVTSLLAFTIYHYKQFAYHNRLHTIHNLPFLQRLTYALLLAGQLFRSSSLTCSIHITLLHLFSLQNILALHAASLAERRVASKCLRRICAPEPQSRIAASAIPDAAASIFCRA